MPQDKKYAGEPTRLEIGDRNTIREFCTFNCGTAQDAGVTRVGNDNWIMAYVHLAHDCQVGNHTIFANNAQLAGHVHVGDWAILGGFTVVHQFVRIGAHSMTAHGHRSCCRTCRPTSWPPATRRQPHGINSEGLKRRGFSRRRHHGDQARLQDALQVGAEARRGAWRPSPPRREHAAGTAACCSTSWPQPGRGIVR